MNWSGTSYVTTHPRIILEMLAMGAGRIRIYLYRTQLNDRKEKCGVGFHLKLFYIV